MLPGFLAACLATRLCQDEGGAPLSSVMVHSIMSTADCTPVISV